MLQATEQLGGLEPRLGLPRASRGVLKVPTTGADDDGMVAFIPSLGSRRVLRLDGETPSISPDGLPRESRWGPATAALPWSVALVVWLTFLGGPLSAPAIAAGAASTTTTATGPGLLFAGRSWSLKAGAGPLGPGPNLFSNALQNIWVDAVGQLHLRITNLDGQWQAAEVLLNESLGYGIYSFVVASPIGALDPNVVLGLFTWNDDPAYNHREVDIEFARWSNAGGPTNAQYVVHSNDLQGTLQRFVQPSSAPSVHAFTWARKSVTFASAASGSQAIASWRYTGSGIPRPGGERTHINLWLNHGTPPVNGAAVEVVLSNFYFAR